MFIKSRNKARLLSSSAVSFSFPKGWPAQGIIHTEGTSGFVLTKHDEKLDIFLMEPPHMAIKMKNVNYSDQTISVFNTQEDAAAALAALQTACRKGTHPWLRRMLIVLSLNLAAVLAMQGVIFLRAAAYIVRPASVLAPQKTSVNQLDPATLQKLMQLRQQQNSAAAPQTPAAEAAPETGADAGDLMLQKLQGNKN